MAAQTSHKLTRKFYDKSCVELSKALLGKKLVRLTESGERTSGVIVETEAYLGGEDKAAHSFNGKKTERNAAMFMQPGTAYVYNIYGMYSCINISSKGEGAAVLIRAIDPDEGMDIMKRQRAASKKSAKKDVKVTDIGNGPSKLTQALNIDKPTVNEQDLTTCSFIWLEDADPVKEEDIVVSSRIGLSASFGEWTYQPLRYYVHGNKSVSVRDKKAEGLEVTPTKKKKSPTTAIKKRSSACTVSVQPSQDMTCTVAVQPSQIRTSTMAAQPSQILACTAAVQPSQKLTSTMAAHPSRKLDRKFFDRSCVELTKALLGKKLVRLTDTGERTSGVIVETEAYLGGEDKAAHSFNGKKTERNAAMFMQPGTAYVYNIYGMYSCINISSQGEGAAVLIRAIDPDEGIDIMKRQRAASKKGAKKDVKVTDLGNGPSKLTQALNIDKPTVNQQDLTTCSFIWLEDARAVKEEDVVVSSRIGLNASFGEWTSKPLRFYIHGNKSVSVRDKKAEGLEVGRNDKKRPSARDANDSPKKSKK